MKMYNIIIIFDTIHLKKYLISFDVIICFFLAGELNSVN